MKNELLDSFLGKTLEYLNSAEAFLQKNVPAYVEELLTFDFYSAVMWLLFFPAVAIVFAIATRKIYLLHKKSESRGSKEDYEMIGGLCAAITAIFFVISLVSTPINVERAIKIKLAPRVYLVEKISAQMRQEK